MRLWGRRDAIDDATLLVSEMFTNALRHAPSQRYVVAVDWNGGKIRLEMWDSSEHRPTLLPIDALRESGRGMHLISALSAAWGARVTASGKCVWVILPTAGRDAP
jgi:anti-sigma regulatory factor (Ser/Thr protein kinase)